MNIINSFDSFKELTPKEKFWIFRNGQIYSYVFMGINPASKDIVVAISDANYQTAVTFTKMDFRQNKVFMNGKYDSTTAGEMMIAQLNNHIQSVEKIYLKQNAEI